MRNLHSCIYERNVIFPLAMSLSLFSLSSITGGELFERIVDDTFDLTESEVISYMRQICAGVQHMHHHNIMHLDLKPENIMCVNRTGFQLKIIDFGLARKYEPGNDVKVGVSLFR